MALLATQVVRGSGLGPTYAAATGGGDTCAVSAGSFLHVKNASGGSITVTIDDPLTPVPDGSAANPDNVVAVGASGEKMIALDPTRHVNPTDGLAHITYSGVTSLTIACIQGPGR